MFSVLLTASLPASADTTRSIADTSVSWPSLADIIRVLLLRDYNTRVVVLSTATLGVAAGLIGSFLLLRKRALMGDALSHATLPGIGAAFMVMASAGGTGKWLPGLLIGASITGLIGVGCVMAITKLTRLKDDAALGIVLSVFFGMGVALLGLIQDMPQGSAAGLETFIYGKAASVIGRDLWLIVAVAVAVIMVCGVMFKEFSLLCFDDQFAAAQGWPVTALDLVMLGLVTTVTVIGLQAVGLILIIAMLIVPPAAARFWTDHLPKMTAASALIGAISGWLGASLSALLENLPAGAVIVVVAATVFIFSMLFGGARGVVRRTIDHRRLTHTVMRQHLLRALYERVEEAPRRGIAFGDLLQARSWSSARLWRMLRSASHEGLATRTADGGWRLTEAGRAEAQRIVRNHRLWEIYLITHADIAPSHVDRDADAIEHVLGPAMVARLERLLDQQTTAGVPVSPHSIE